MLTPSNHAANIPSYAFATLAKQINQLNARGADIIRLDIGNPDMPPPARIIDTLVEYSRKENSHGYGGYIGIPPFREAIAAYYKNRFGVSLDVQTELTPLIGSKEGIANINLAWIDPGDIALVPDPGYPTYSQGARLANGVPYAVPLRPENNWQPDFSAIPPDVARKARILWLNYPNNPTGAVVDLAFFEEAIAFCRANNILLCHDNPYCDVTYNGYSAGSPLQIPGAKDVVLEFNSLSKTYNLAGWRIGMAAGNPAAIKALSTVKTQIDTGLSLPVQRMAVEALTGDQSWIADRNHVYRQRRDMVVETLTTLGLEATAPQATLYIWFPAPNGYTDIEFHKKALAEARVSIAPGSIYGQHGADWMRLSISTPTPRLEEAMNRLEEAINNE